MKILIISNMYPSKEKPYSGIFVKNQYEYLKYQLKQDVEIYTIKRTFTSKVGSIIKYLKAFILFFPFFFKKYDVIHLHYFFPMIILAVLYQLFHPKTKIVVTFHGSDITSFINSKLSKKFFKLLINKCDYIISVGEDLSKLVYEKLYRKSDLILSAGIDENVFYQDNKIKKEYDFIFVGSFIKRKGLDILIKAIKHVDDKNIKYCIVGSGILEQEVVNIAQTYNVTLLKNQTQTELRTLYNKSKFFILPSRDEPFGLVVSEAIFCGTPAIVSNIGGMKNQIKNKFNGFILSENTFECLSTIIIELMKMDNEQYQTLTENTLTTNKEYSMSNVCNISLNIYRELLNE